MWPRAETRLFSLSIVHMTIDNNTALVLEGGGLRWVFTCGVLDYFMDNGIRFPFTVGVSVGACNGLSYMSGHRSDGERHRETGCFIPGRLRYCLLFEVRGNISVVFFFIDISYGDDHSSVVAISEIGIESGSEGLHCLRQTDV